MNIDTRIYGYIGDGFIVCCPCAEKYQTSTDDGGLSPLGAYSGILDRACGESCGDCHEWIVEPDHDDEACSDCGYEPAEESDTSTVTLIGLHKRPGPLDTVVLFYGEDEAGTEVVVAVDHRPGKDLADALLAGPVEAEVEAWQVLARTPGGVS